MSGSSNTPIVVDVGSDSCKAGFAGEETPKIVLPSVTGQYKQAADGCVDKTKPKHIGQAAIDLAEELTLKYLVERGVVTDWENMEVFLDCIFKDKLSVQTTDHPVLMTEAPKNPKDNREKMAEVMFEKFQVPAFFCSYPAVLCLYSAGRSTGLVLDIGSGVTTAVPVYEGYSLSDAVMRVNFAGSDITEYLTGLLSARGYQFLNASDKLQVRNIKEKLCRVSQDFQKDLSEWPSSSACRASYKLPDGKELSLETESFQCTEVLFQPSISGRSENPGIHQMVNSAISACELDTRKSLYTNVILSGGSSLFEGMADRLKHELKSFGPLGNEARISAPKDRLLSAWIGGSVLASMTSFEGNCISKKDYDESGPQIVHSRCF